MTSPDGGSFLYPGMGDSTFRAYAFGDAAVAAEMISDGFIFDDSPELGDIGPIENFGDINFGGTFYSPAISGETPLAWGTY